MKTLKTRNLALLLPLFYEFARQVRDGVIDWANRNPDWRMIELNPNELHAGKSVGRHLDGVIFWFATKFSPPSSEIARWNIPAVNCGMASPAMAGIKQLANVTFDRNSIGRLAVEHFAELGFEVVGYVGMDLHDHRGLRSRVQAMREAALARGMEWVDHDLGKIDPERLPGLIWEGGRSKALTSFLAKVPKPVALLAQDDYIGSMLCETAAAMGLSVPGDVAVLGQGNRLLGHRVLSSVVLPGEQVGRMAATLIEKWLRGESPPPEPQMLPCEGIVVRSSTGGLSHDPNIERAKRYFDRHKAEGVTVGQLAAVSGYSAKTLRNRFSELYRIEITKTTRDARCDEILGLLKGTDLTIAEIGRKCGFESASGLCNFLIRQTGMGPLEHRGKRRSLRQGGAEGKV